MRDRRSPCPVACALDLVGDRWTLLVVRDLACGKATFGEMAKSPERIATNILADRLSRLVDQGLAERRPSPDRAGRDEYRLTPKGESLLPVLRAIADWGLANIEGTAAHLKPSTAGARGR
jgi:DNA-binding HxlR family transcriptional regulator